jgi:hypothetical protein
MSLIQEHFEQWIYDHYLGLYSLKKINGVYQDNFTQVLQQVWEAGYNQSQKEVSEKMAKNLQKLLLGDD